MSADQPQPTMATVLQSTIINRAQIRQTGLRRYQEHQHAVCSLSARQGVALLRAEQEARSKLAQQAPVVLARLAAEARQKIAAQVASSAGVATLQAPTYKGSKVAEQCLTSSPVLHSPCRHTSRLSITASASRRCHSRTAVWPAAAGAVPHLVHGCACSSTQLQHAQHSTTTAGTCTDQHTAQVQVLTGIDQQHTQGGMRQPYQAQDISSSCCSSGAHRTPQSQHSSNIPISCLGHKQRCWADFWAPAPPRDSMQQPLLRPPATPQAPEGARGHAVAACGHAGSCVPVANCPAAGGEVDRCCDRTPRRPGGPVQVLQLPGNPGMTESSWGVPSKSNTAEEVAPDLDSIKSATSSVRNLLSRGRCSPVPQVLMTCHHAAVAMLGGSSSMNDPILEPLLTGTRQ